MSGFPQTLDYAQLQGAWIAGGGSSASAPMAAAIAIPESGGQTNNVNTNTSTDPGGSFGLWQINRGAHQGSLGPGWFASSGLAWTGGPSIAAWGGPWTDPPTNAAEAVALSGNGQSWQPWATTYNSGAWQQYYNPSAQPVPGNQPLPGNQNPGGGYSGPGSIYNPGGWLGENVIPNIPGAAQIISGGNPFADWLAGVSAWWQARPIALLIVAVFIVFIGFALLLSSKSGEGQTPQPLVIQTGKGAKATSTAEEAAEAAA
jgi:hypothetical protein